MAASRSWPCTVALTILILVSVTAQTFQYSRGWTNGKRNGYKHSDETKNLLSTLERILNPCQLRQLYILEGKPFNEKLFTSCDYVEDNEDSDQKRAFSKSDRVQDIFDSLT